MNKKYFFLLGLSIILFLSLHNVTAAHYIIGHVNNASDGTSPNGYTAVLGTNTSFTTNLTDTIGPTGNSGVSNTYMIDCELSPISCYVGQNLYVRVVNSAGVIYSKNVEVAVSGAGYDLAPNLTLYSNSQFINVISPLNNSYHKSAYFKINTTIDNLNSCSLNTNNTGNITMSRIKNYITPSFINKFNTALAGTTNAYSVTPVGSNQYVLDKINHKVYIYSNGTYTGNEFTISYQNPQFTDMVYSGGYLYTTQTLEPTKVDKWYKNGTYISQFSTIGTNLTSLTTNGTYIWVWDYLGTHKIYKYWMNGTYTGDSFTNNYGYGGYGLGNNNTDLFISGSQFINGYSIGVLNLSGSLVANYSNNTVGINAAGTLNGMSNNGTYIWSILQGSTNDYIYKNYLNNASLISKTNTYNPKLTNNRDPKSMTNNGTYMWILDSGNNTVDKYWMNGTYTGILFNLTNTTNSYGIGNDNTYFYVVSSNSTKDFIGKYYLNGTPYSTLNYSYGLQGISCNATLCEVINNTQVLSINKTNGNLVKRVFNLTTFNSEPYGLFFNNNYTYVSDTVDNQIYIYNKDGSLNKTYTPNSTHTVGLDGNSTNLFISDTSKHTIGNYLIKENSNSFDYTQTLSDGYHHTNFYCNDTSGSVTSTSINFYLDTVAPKINITYPLNISYNTTISSLNYIINDISPVTCWYSLDNGKTNSSKGACNNYTGLSTSFGLNTWVIYANDSAGNFNYSKITFDETVPPSPGGGGGGGSTPIVYPTIGLQAPKNTTSTLTDLDKSIIFAVFNNYCANLNKGLAIINFYQQCQFLGPTDLKKIQAQINQFQIPITASEMPYWYDQYKLNQVFQTYASQSQINQYNLASAIITNPLVITPPQLNAPFILPTSKILSYTFLASKQIAQCDVISNTPGLNCTITGNTTAQVRYTLKDTNFFTTSLSGEISITSGTVPKDEETRYIQLNFNPVINFGYRVLGIPVGIVIIVVILALITSLIIIFRKRIKIPSFLKSP